MRWAALCCAVLGVALVPAAAGDVSSDAEARVVFASLAGINLSAAATSAVDIIPAALMRAVSFVDRRKLAGAEAAGIRRSSALSEIAGVTDRVAAARKARDLAALTIRDRLWRQQRIRELEATIETVTEAMETSLQSLSSSDETGSAVTGTPAGIPEPESETWIKLVVHPANEGGALPEAKSDLATTALSLDADLVVGGTVRLIGMYLRVDIVLYIAATGRTQPIGTEFVALDNLAEVTALMTRPLATALFAADYSLVTLRRSPAGADIRMDGEPFVESRRVLFEDRVHEIVADLEGFGSQSVKIRTEPGKDIAVQISLNPLDSIPVTISSIPEGASVHIDGMLLGTTPLTVPPAAFTRVVRLSMADYATHEVTLRPDKVPETMTVRLEASDALSFDQRYDASKDSFYRALGWFVSSLPVTVVSGGLFQLYYSTGNDYLLTDGDSPDQETITRLNTAFYTSQTVFWVSAAASLGLAINAALQLAGYLGTAR